MKKHKLLQKILVGMNNVRFQELQKLVEAYGFNLERITGSHHIYGHPQIPEVVNLQEVKGKAKPYQVRQFLSLVEKYNLSLGEEL